MAIVSPEIPLPSERSIREAPGQGRGRRPRFDLVGLLLAASGMVGVLLGLSNVSNDGGFGHCDVLLPLIIGLVLLAAFAAWAVRRMSTGRVAGSALVNMRLLRVRSVGASGAGQRG